MRTTTRYTDAIPTDALPYIVNGDASGMDADDIAAADAYMEALRAEAEKVDGYVEVIPSGEPYFTWHPAFGLACNVEDCTVVIVAPDDYPVVWTPDGLQHTFTAPGEDIQPALF